MSAITRSVSEIRNVVVSSNCPELSYADAVNSKLAKLQERIKEVSIHGFFTFKLSTKFSIKHSKQTVLLIVNTCNKILFYFKIVVHLKTQI